MKSVRMSRAVFSVILCFLLLGCGSVKTKPRDILLAEAEARRLQRQKSMKLYREGWDAYKKSDMARARSLIDKSIQSDQRNECAWMAKGMLEYERDSFYEAGKAFHRVIALQPKRYEPHFNIGMILEESGKYTQAIRKYEVALKLAPDQVEVMENLSRCYIATNTNLDKALKLINRAKIAESRPEWKRWLTIQSRTIHNKLKKPDCPVSLLAE